MVDRVLALPEGTRLYLLAPVVRAEAARASTRKGSPDSSRGLSARQDRRHVHELAEAPTLDKKFPHDIDVVVDHASWSPRHGPAPRPKA
jgi:excinuclease ABC subunit A